MGGCLGDPPRVDRTVAAMTLQKSTYGRELLVMTPDDRRKRFARILS